MIDTIRDEEEVEIGFPLLSDPERKTIAAWGVADPVRPIALPSVFVVDPSGTVRFRQVGDTIIDRAGVDEIVGSLEVIGGEPGERP